MATTLSASKSSTRSAGASAPRCRNWPRRSAGSRRQWRACAATPRVSTISATSLPRQAFCCVFGGTVRDWLWAGLSGLIIGFVTRWLDRLEVNQFFQHHRGVVSHGPAGIYRGRAGLARLRGCGHHRRADAACAGAVDHKLHARHHLRRHQLRRQPNRAGAALGVCHRARHGGRVARHRAALWPCGGSRTR